MALKDLFKKKAKKTETKPIKKEKTQSEKKSSSLKLKSEAATKVAPSAKREKSGSGTGKSASLAYKIIIRPVITEKAAELMSHNKYVFEVDTAANKSEIRKAIKALYNVTPEGVQVMTVGGKKVQRGYVSGKRKKTKKAIVNLRSGDKIEIYEGI